MTTKRERILALADGTRTAPEIAALTETKIGYVCQVAPGRFRKRRSGPKRDNQHRNRAMIALRQCGASYREIGKQFGISHERVHQIVSRGID